MMGGSLQFKYIFLAKNIGMLRNVFVLIPLAQGQYNHLMKMKIGYARFPHLPLFPSFIIFRKNNAMLYVNLLYTVMHCVQIASDKDKWTDTKPHR